MLFFINRIDILYCTLIYCIFYVNVFKMMSYFELQMNE